jgi:hypothetical protein
MKKINLIATMLVLAALVSCTKEKNVSSQNSSNLEFRQSKAPVFLSKMISISKSNFKAETEFINTDSALIYTEDALNYALDSAVNYQLIFNDSFETSINAQNTIGINEVSRILIYFGRGIQNKIKNTNLLKTGVMSIALKKTGNVIKCYYNYGGFATNSILGKGPGGPVFATGFWYPITGPLGNYYSRYWGQNLPDYDYLNSSDKMLVAACLFQYKTYTSNILAIPSVSWRKIYYNHYECNKDYLVSNGSIPNPDNGINSQSNIARISSGGYQIWPTSINSFKSPGSITVETSVIPWATKLNAFTTSEPIFLLKADLMNYYKDQFPTLIQKHKTFLISQNISGIANKELSKLVVADWQPIAANGNLLYNPPANSRGLWYFVTYSNCYVSNTYTTNFFN